MYYMQQWAFRVVGSGLMAAGLSLAWNLGNASETGDSPHVPRSAEPEYTVPDAWDATMGWPFAEGDDPFAEVPGWTPFWHPRLPQPPFPPMPFAPPQVKSIPADPGTMQVEETVHSDAFEGQYLVRRRSWTAGGVPHHEVTVISPPPSEATGSQEAGAAEPDQEGEASQQLQDGEASEMKEASGDSTQPGPAPNETPLAEQRNGGAAISRQSSSVRVSVSADAHQGVQIRHHVEGDAAGVSQSWGAAAVGARADSKQGVRIYRYHGGTPSPAADR